MTGQRANPTFKKVGPIPTQNVGMNGNDNPIPNCLCMSLAGGCTHHVPLCTDVGSRPKDHQQTDVVGQLKEMVQIPVPAEIELARRLLVVAPGDVTSAWIKRQYYPNTHSGYLSAALVNIHQSRGQPTLHRLYRQS